MLDDFLDAPALGRHLEAELRVGEALELADEPGFRHLEMRDEPLALAGRHRSGGQGDGGRQNADGGDEWAVEHARNLGEADLPVKRAGTNLPKSVTNALPRGRAGAKMSR